MSGTWFDAVAAAGSVLSSTSLSSEVSQAALDEQLSTSHRTTRSRNHSLCLREDLGHGPSRKIPKIITDGVRLEGI